jgi:aminoglycoside phosphotransferase (APT) family kinase protein
MRTHNHLETKEICRKAIDKLTKIFGLDAVETIRTDELGWVNPVFFVNEKYVFRFNARDTNLPKLQREKIAYGLSANIGLPVPKILAFDDSKKISLFDVMVMEKIDGSNIESEWLNLKLEQRAKLAEQAGKLLRKIHSIPLNYFGDLSERSPLPQTKSWFEFLQEKVEFHLNEAMEISLFTVEQLTSIAFILKKMKSQISSIKTASLVHVDFHFGNLLHKNFEIVGILDFEWSFSGDPFYDLCFYSKMDETWPDSNVNFLKGYGVTDFDDEQKLRMKFYQMIRNINLCIVAKKHFSDEESQDYLLTTSKKINELEKVLQETI